MNRNEIDLLRKSTAFSQDKGIPELRETHISWLILTDRYVYKIKKPVTFSFLDFSTLRSRGFYCRREVLLNSRWAEGIYIDYLPIYRKGDEFFMGRDHKQGELIEYAVMMNRLPDELHLPHLLKSGKVTVSEMRALGAQLARIHHDAPSVKVTHPLRAMRTYFEDIKSILPQVEHWPSIYRKVIEALLISDRFLNRYGDLIEHRAATNWFRDVHGDLHVGNIFLTRPAVIFDCIEFSDPLRQIDILDELAFLTMDLEGYGYPELSQALQEGYHNAFPAEVSRGDHLLYTYYQLYRASVRLKVAVLSIPEDGQVFPELRNQIYRYAGIMRTYIENLEEGMQQNAVA